MSEELKPCPFCSCTDIGEVTINHRLEPRHRRFKVYCKVCQCRTSEHKTRKEARIYWNTRTLPQPAAVEDVQVVAVVTTAYKKGVSEQRALWHGESGADEWIAHMQGRGCETTKTLLMDTAQHNRIMAATVPAGCKVVPVWLLERIPMDILKTYGYAQTAQKLRAILEVKP